MKRPQNAGRGLDGVARRSPEYYNPAIELLETVQLDS
jgi:beta-lysine 5,6-aminomutase alpha subunit